VTKLADKIFLFFLITSYSLLVTIPIHAAEPGLNVINNIKSRGIVPNSNDINWLVYTPESPDQLKNVNFDVNNVVVRIHSAWTKSGKLMLGLPAQQQQVASSWCQAINTVASKGKRVFVEPFNELEHDYERLTPQGGIGLNSAISRANTFISYLRPCLSSPTTVISPALDPQSADFATTSQAFSGFDIISCHPYRNDTIGKCTSGPLANKQYLFTEIGVDKNGAKYDNCLFIEQFCQENFIQNLNNTSGLIAYFLFTFAPGNANTSWQLTSHQVVSALKGQCTPDLILNCDSDTDAVIDQIVQNIKNKPDPDKVAPVPDRGIIKGPLQPGNIHFIQSAINMLKALLSHKTANQYPFAYKDTDQYVEDPFIQSGDLPDMIKIYQPPSQIIDQVGTILQTNSVNLLGVQDSIITGYSNKEYSDIIDYAGPGWMFSVYSPHYDFALDKETAKKDFFDLKSGISARQTPYEQLNDDEVDDILCQLAASADPGNPYFKSNPEERLFDEVLGYLSPNTENEFIYDLPINNPHLGPGIVDRTKTSFGDSPVPIRISTLFCTNKNLDSFLTKCSKKGFGNINPIVCSSTPHWLKNPDLEGAFFSTFYPRLRQRAQMLSQNASAKGFLERCQEQEPEECDKNSGSLFSTKTIITSDFGSLDPDIRTRILNQENGAYNKLKGLCYSCRTTVIFFPNLTKANQTISYVGKMSTPYKTHENLNDVPNTITYSRDDIKKTGVHNIDPKAPMGMANPQDKHQDENLNILEGLRSFFSRKVDIENCSISYQPNDQGVLIPTNVCQGQKTSKLETILYVSPQVYEFINSSQNFYNNLTPYNIQAKIESSIENATGSHSKTLNSLTKAEMVSGNQMGGLLTSVQQYLSRKIDISGRQLVPDSADKIAYGKSLAAQEKVQQLMFTPYSWQNQSTDKSNQYQTNQPKTDQDLNQNFSSDVLSYCNQITSAATSVNLEPSLVAALISIESDGNPNAISNQGAVGLMQVMPSDAKDKDGNPLYFDCGGHDCFINRPTTAQLLNPQYNISYGTRLLSGMINYWGGVTEGLTHYGPVGYNGYAQLIFDVQSQNPTACQ